eukprot:CAMPEP_0179472690 /NCGR_PEP_ID=MMETSP0799-20121207/52629_1 /TAXON_ID=46947 /ORGANISM="Geminigera cryophila, Strain CCMP2564" /LENGTH=355 /DNA_ID=CAMNT_0021280971 /DNA_START=921 /DNA_END=1987 /DNA_ORIENTATION=-
MIATYPPEPPPSTAASPNSEGIARLERNGIIVDVMDGTEAQQHASPRMRGGGGEFAQIVLKAVEVVQEGLTSKTSRPQAFCDLAAAALAPYCQDHDTSSDTPTHLPLISIPLSGSHFVLTLSAPFPSSSFSPSSSSASSPSSPPDHRWVVISEGAVGYVVLALALLDEAGEVVVAVMGNSNAREEACVMAAVKGAGVRYWPRTAHAPSLMALSQEDNRKRCWDQTAMQIPIEVLPYTLVSPRLGTAQGLVPGLMAQEETSKDTWQTELLRHVPGMLCVEESGGSARYHRVNFPGASSYSFPVQDSTDMEAGGNVMGAAAGGRVTGVIAIAAAAEVLGIGQMMREHLVSVLAARSV